MASVDDLRIDAPPPRPHRRGPSYTPLILLIALAAFVWWMLGRPVPPALQGLLKGQAASPATPAAGPGTTSAATPGGSTVQTEPASLAATSAPSPAGSFSAGGYIEVIPPGPRAVSPLFAGKVAKVYVAPGDHVTKGQLLAEIDSSLLKQQAVVLQSQVELARSQLKLKQAGFRNEEVQDAQSAVDRAQARLTRATSDAARALRLFQAGVSAKAEYDAAVSEQGQAQAELASAQAQLALKQSGSRKEDVGISLSELKVAQAELTQVQFNIGQCKIKAPLDGVVYALYTTEGGWVDPADGGEAHAALLSIFDPRQIQAYADVNQRDSARVKVGQSVELVADAAPQSPVHGVVERIMPQANLQKNTVRAIIRIVSPPEFLKPEMNLKVSFLAPAGSAVSSGGAQVYRPASPSAPAEAGAKSGSVEPRSIGGAGK